MSQAEPLLHNDRLRTVRAPAVHDSAIRHVSGQALYVDDIPEPPGTLHVAPGLAPVAAGRVTGLDLAAAAAAPGVVAVLTGDNVPSVREEGPFGAGDAVAFHGDVLFAVVARHRAAARRAVRLARLSTTPAMAIIDAEDALAADSTVAPKISVHRGDAAMEILRCDWRVTGQFRCGGQEHFALEPQSALAVPGEDRHITIHCATEEPGAVRRSVAAMLGVSEATITVETRRIGGGFGGKAGPATQWARLAALAAWQTGRPCKVRLERDEEFLTTGKRIDYRAEYNAGLAERGRIAAAEMTLVARMGQGLDGGGAAVERALLHADNAYFIPALRVSAQRMRTQTVPAAAFRGLGGPEGALVTERLMDHIARSLGLDPLDVRKENLYGPGRDTTHYGMQLDEVVLPTLVAELERTSDYRRRRIEVQRFNETSPILRKGLALVPAKYGVGAPDANRATALVELCHDGSLRLSLGGVEGGQGLSIKAAQIAAEEFGLPLDRLVIAPTSTAVAAGGASSGLDSNLSAVLTACKAIKDRLYDFAEEVLKVDRERIEFRDEEVLLGSRPMAFAAFIESAVAHQVSLTATGVHAVPEIEWDIDKGLGRPFHYFAYGAACAEVTIDIMTGERRIDRVDILQDAGRSVNPAVDRGQIEGGFLMGVGWLTSEELVWDSAGRLVTRDGATYAVPRAGDVPADFRVELFHSGGNRAETPYRSKDVGDAAVMLALSVFSAIGDAIGSIHKGGAMPRLNAPATPEAIMRAVRSLGDGA
ncbi:MAG: molybdopterin-dependent oxidoreductase [Bauldia sp.]|nr:molybdopterin-dependent oxidoreductase [Bauldia sp.]